MKIWLSKLFSLAQAGADQKRRQRGAALAELAVISPLLMFTMLGGIDFARLYHDAIALDAAAHAGAKWGAHSPENGENFTGIQSAVTANLSDAHLAQEVEVNADPKCYCGVKETEVDCDATCGAGNDPSRYIYVTVTANFEPLFDYPGFPETILLDGEAEVRVTD